MIDTTLDDEALDRIPEDEIVAQVRAIRLGFAAAAGFDLRTLAGQWNAIQEAERAHGRVIIAAPSAHGGPEAT